MSTSLIIPTYNRADMLPQAIASCLAQSLDDLEIIVVDDGSTDNTREVVAGFADPRIRYIYQENQGATAAFNAGLEKSRGRYVSILGSDDWYLPDGLIALDRLLDIRPEVGVAAGGYRLVDQEGNRIGETRPWEQQSSPNTPTTWFFDCPVLLPAALIRREWLERVGKFDSDVRIAQDWDLGLRLAQAGCRMVWVEQLVFCYRLHGSNSVHNGRQLKQDTLLSLTKFFARDDLTPEVLSCRERAYAWAYLTSASRGYAVEAIAEAQEDLAQAITADPSLRADGGAWLTRRLASVARNPLLFTLEGSIRQIHTIWDHLPPTAAFIAGRRGQALAELAALRFFEAHREGNWPAVRRAAWAMLRHEPSRLRDRGVASICLEAVVGPRIAAWARSLLRGVPR